MLDAPNPELAALWHNARTTATDGHTAPSLDRELLSGLSREPRRESVRAHVGTTVVLGVTLAILIWILRQYFTSATYTAYLGLGLMIGSLAGRVLVEVASLVLLLRIDFTDATRAFVTANRRFLKFRWNIHKGFVAITLVMYAAGFYCLVYAAAGHYPTWVLVLSGASFPVIMGAVYLLAIRPGQGREREALTRLDDLAAQVATGT